MAGILALLCLAVAPPAPGDYLREIAIGGSRRHYRVHVPSRYDHKKMAPLVLAFHGGGGNPESMALYCGLNTKADEAGFVVAYPAGTGRLEKILTFNAGNCCGYAMSNEIDDVGFTRMLIDDLSRDVKIDPKRVYATGMSNGAIMSYRLASELSDRIAAIAPVAGPMGAATCNPGRAVSVIHFHGTDDENAPFKGGKGKGASGTDFYSVEHSIREWVRVNGCSRDPVVTNLPVKVNDGTSIVLKTHGSGKEGAEVILVMIEGGGHTWPGRPPRLRSLGKSTGNISANDLMWEFFEKHPMR